MEPEAEDAPAASSRIGWLRLGIGALQGLCAWLLLRRPEAFDPAAFSALVLVVGYVPLIVLAGVGRMRPAALTAWTAAATILLVAAALYDHWRDPVALGLDQVRRGPSFQLGAFSAVGLYVAHHIIEPADEERRFPPSFPMLFESAWRHGFQLGLSLAFTAVFWGVLQLGAALFDLIGVKGLREAILSKPWFACPATAIAFAAAVHLTDVRPSLIRGVRTVALTLFAWLVPLTAALSLAFLAALPFTGLHRLWETRFAGALLLWSAAVLIVLLNAAYQDGRSEEKTPAILRYAGRAAALVLVPLVALAAWAAGLRIVQHGLTPERIASVAVVTIAFVYALGYAWAALDRGPWMKRLEAVNLVAAGVILASILVLFSPILDPARLSTNDQVARLRNGQVTATGFDYAFLRFRAARFGREALAALTKSPDAVIAQRAKAVAAATNPYALGLPKAGEGAEPPFSHARIFPAGAVLPTTFRSQVWTTEEAGYEASAGCFLGGAACELYLRDLDGDGRPEVLLQGYTLRAYGEGADGRWALLGTFANGACEGVRAALEAGDITPAPARLPNLKVGGQLLAFQAGSSCQGKKKVVSPPPAVPSAPSTPPFSPAFHHP